MQGLGAGVRQAWIAARRGRGEAWWVKQRFFQQESVDSSFSFVCLKISLLFSVTQIVL